VRVKASFFRSFAILELAVTGQRNQPDALSKPETEHSRDFVACKIRETNIDQDEIRLPA
jgi:hypothetical protein